MTAPLPTMYRCGSRANTVSPCFTPRSLYSGSYERFTFPAKTHSLTSRRATRRMTLVVVANTLAIRAQPLNTGEPEACGPFRRREDPSLDVSERRSEEHTSELQSQSNLACPPLL